MLPRILLAKNRRFTCYVFETTEYVILKELAHIYLLLKQVLPSPIEPALQVHVYEPSVFLHTAFT